MAVEGLSDRGISVALTAAGAVLLAWRPRPAVARAAWLILLLAGMISALALNLDETTIINANLAHHYLGAKYALPYPDFYKVVQAGLGQPQIGLRDLEHPQALLRPEPWDQRAYYIDLLRASGATFIPTAPLETLARQAETSGAIAAESERILRQALPDGRIEEFRRDVRAATAGIKREPLTQDFGFNGSPFYALTRHLDPALHFPFGRITAWFNLAGQLLSVLLLAWIAGKALSLSLEERLAAGALLMASWDFAGWALPGLIFGEVWLPVALALLALRHRRAGLAGVAIAWAGLIKLFPFLLVLPAALRWLKPGRGPGSRALSGRAASWPLHLLAACALAVPALGLTALLSGRSWGGFLHKIVVEFQSEVDISNSVSLHAALRTLGVHHSALPPLLSLAALLPLAAMFLRDRDEELLGSLPRRSLILLAATGWMVRTWLNYYAVLPLLLLPLYARGHRKAAPVAALSLAAAFALPEFGDPGLLARPGLHFLKILPYLVLPAWMAYVELRGAGFSRRLRRTGIIVASGLLLLSLAEVGRMRAVQRFDETGKTLLDSGDAAGALDRYTKLLQLDPGNGLAHLRKGAALATLGRLDEAGAEFTRAAALQPGNAAAEKNYGRLLLMQGKPEDAQVHISKALALAPNDPAILLLRARVERAQNRRVEELATLNRALELQPGDRAVLDLLQEAGGK